MQLIEGEPLFAPAVLNRWHEDMSNIQRRLSRESTNHPLDTNLASGGLGPLLGMLPNANYDGVPQYADPPLPWTPTPLLVPAEPRVENAGNIMARTFVDAHAQDWCDVLHEDGDDEFSLNALRDRCIEATEAGDGDVACGICDKFASWWLWPSSDGEHRAEDAPVCERLAGASSQVVSTEELALEYVDQIGLASDLYGVELLSGANPAEAWCGREAVLFTAVPRDPVCENLEEHVRCVFFHVGRISAEGYFHEPSLELDLYVMYRGERYAIGSGIPVGGGDHVFEVYRGGVLMQSKSVSIDSATCDFCPQIACTCPLECPECVSGTC